MSAGYQLHLRHADVESIIALRRLDDLADRVGFEQLAHELNPVDPTGYVVAFHVVGPGSRTPAAGHFYVRAAADVAAVVESGNSPS